MALVHDGIVREVATVMVTATTTPTSVPLRGNFLASSVPAASVRLNSTHSFNQSTGRAERRPTEKDKVNNDDRVGGASRRAEADSD